MLGKSDTAIENVMKIFASHGQEAGYIVPTETGMTKSILDAHATLRDFLKTKGIHDFETQGQGKENKKKIDVFLIEEGAIKSSTMSLYRPETKSGDPRLWVYGLTEYADAYNLLAFFLNDEKLYLVNASNSSLLAKAEEILRVIGENLDNVALSLLAKLNKISARGFVETLREGDTGVGMTLETLLGIEANANRAPDFHGVEIKAKRVSGRSNKVSTRATLFSQVPDWNISNCRNGISILRKYGYIDERTNRLQLYCTNSHRPNPQGLCLRINENLGMLESIKINDDNEEQIVVWKLDNLRKQLEDKHKRTFWVKAKTRVNAMGKEEFYYYEVEQTSLPLTSNFSTLVEIGAITMDYTLSEKATGNSARDHGYLFKIHPANFDLLFPPSKTISLQPIS
jgi:hypothetical protein